MLRVHGLDEPPLRLAADPQPGTAAAILGYPLDGRFDAEPGRIGQTEDVSTEDAYGNGPILRSITALRGRVRPGNSGGPMVDRAGQVVATVFAAITARRPARAASPCRTRWYAEQLRIAESQNTGSAPAPARVRRAAAGSKRSDSTLWAGGGLHTARP